MKGRRDSDADDSRLSGQSLTGLTAVCVLLLFVLALSLITSERLSRSKHLMTQSLNIQGALLIKALEGATRMGMRRGGWRSNDPQALLEEMAGLPYVNAIAIIDGGREVLAAAQLFGTGENPRQGALAGLPPTILGMVTAGKPVAEFVGEELVLGRPFDPFNQSLVQDGIKPPGAHRGLGEDRDQVTGPQFPGDASMQRRFGQGMMDRRFMKSYALVRLSTATFNADRDKDLWQAITMAALVLAGLSVALGGLFLVEKHRVRKAESIRRELAQSQYMAALGRLAGAVAHEVRNPLSSIRGLVQYISKDFAPDSRKAEFGETIVAEVDRLERVVAGLLEYTREEHQVSNNVDVNEIVAQAVETVKAEPIADTVNIIMKAKSDLPLISADAYRLRQAIINLLRNALESLNGKGDISLEVESQKDSIVIKVADNGPGLPVKDTNKIFEPFFSTKERGAGLGLALARKTIQLHGGELTAEVNSPRGSVFQIVLPRFGLTTEVA